MGSNPTPATNTIEGRPDASGAPLAILRAGVSGAGTGPGDLNGRPYIGPPVAEVEGSGGRPPPDGEPSGRIPFPLPTSDTEVAPIWGHFCVLSQP